ncbi:MAG: hypothetical protein FGM26_07895, partial [Beijerinckiaceae bacterium]|nr:hypothetical protein [Beijerinckiaceae bacterium]
MTNAKAALEAWGGAFVIADCGFGKSRCISRLLHDINRVTMIVVPQNVLMKQMEEEFIEGEGRVPSFTG